MRRLLLIVVIGLTLAASGWFAVKAVGERDLRDQIRAAKDEISARRIHTAQSAAVSVGPTMAWTGRCRLLDGHVRDDLAQ